MSTAQDASEALDKAWPEVREAWLKITRSEHLDLTKDEMDHLWEAATEIKDMAVALVERLENIYYMPDISQ